MRLIGVVTVLLILIAYYLYTIQKSFNVTFKPDNLELNNFNFQSLNSGKTFFKTKVEFEVFYKAPFKVTFSDLNLQIYYNNVLVSKSSDVPENLSSVTLLPNVNNLAYHTFDVFINSSSIDLAYKIKSKQTYQLNYKLTAKVFGIPVTVNKIYQS